MLKRLALIALALAAAPLAQAQTAPGQTWEAGKQYFLVEPAQPTSTGDKIEVAEVFSYACPACNQFEPMMQQIKKLLPPNAEVTYIPAAFRADEDWPVFQRAFFAAQALGVVDKTHTAMFDAVWKDRSLAIYDQAAQKPLKPTIEDVAKFYEKFGVKPEDFVATANSFAVNTKMKRADAYIKNAGVDSTPTIIVNGKYRITGESAGGRDKIAPLVQYLVRKESGAK